MISVWFLGGAVALFALAQARFLLVCLLTPREMLRAPEVRGGEPPMVCIQIAAFRESKALPSLLTAIGRLDWPRDRLRIQVIDDSAGEEAEATAAVIAYFAAEALPVERLVRGGRSGFKAGALNHGLAHAGDAELIAYFDADCRPHPDFLRRTVTGFVHARVAAVQARWNYPNGRTSPLTAAQQAAFEYLFRYDYEVRTWLGLSTYYLGSAALWRTEALRALGGFREMPFTAEDVDLSCRAADAGWTVLYQPAALADDDALEDVLAFRAQQRRWAYAVGRAALDASPGVIRRRAGALAGLFEATAVLPHATIPVALLTALLLALGIVLQPHREFAAVEWFFSALLLGSPAALALVLAIRRLHPADWLARTALLVRAGPVAAATMTSFVFGFLDHIRAPDLEFVVTPKAGQVGTRRDSARDWLNAFIGPILFDGVVVLLMAAAAAIAISTGRWSAVVPTGIFGYAYAGALYQGLRAVRREKHRLNGLSGK